jgi:hypothetical protein
MFTIDPKITATDLKKKNLFKVFLSMNNHQVATPETSLEEARSYVFFAREGRNRLSAYIGLHLLHTDRKLFYAHSANPFLEDALQDIEEEARYFAEDLGAMLDEVDFASLSEPEQESWIEGQSIFSRKKQPEAAPVEQPPQLATAVIATTVQSSAAPERLTPATEEIRAPEPPAVSVQLVTPAQQPEAQEQRPPQEVPEDAQVAQAKASPLAAAKRRQETQQEAVTIDLEKAPKQTVKKKVFSSTGVVSRDREALARLLTSF